MNLKDEMFSKKNWAIIGATNDISRFGYKIPKLLKDKNYNVFMINPKLDSLLGDKVYGNLSEVEDKIDVINMIVNPRIGKIYLDEAKKLNINYVFFQPGSYDSNLVGYAKELGFEIVLDCVYASLI